MLPPNLQPLLDGDILRYEIGFAAETGWRAKTNSDALPPFDFVEEILLQRIARIKADLNTNKEPIIYFTTGRTFRFDIAKKKPYKGQRKENKPWHFDNLTFYLKNILGAHEVTGIEADDMLAMAHVASNNATVLCSRDKDLKQVPGWFYSWELGKQPSWGPKLITKEGEISLSADHKKIKGSGLAFFYSQVLTGDAVDNIPGLPNTGPVAAFEMLEGKTPAEQLEAVCEAYKRFYGEDEDRGWPEEQGHYYFKAMDELTEQGRLCWLTRRLNEDGSPVLWEIGMEE